MPTIKCSQCNLVNFSTEQNCQRCGNQLNDYAPFADQRPYQTDVEQNYQTRQFQENYEQNSPPTQYQTNFEPTSPTQNFQEPQTNYQNQSYQQPPTQYQPQQSYQQPPQSFQSQPLPNPVFQKLPSQFQTFHLPPANYQNNQYRRTMPSTCIKCGSGQNVTVQNVKKTYVPPLAYVALLIGLVPGAIIVACIRVTHRLNLPFCHDCWSKFKKVWIVETMASLFFFVGIFLGVVAMIATKSGYAFFAVFAMTIGVVVWGQIYKSKHSPKYRTVNRSQVVITDPLNGDVYL